MTEARTKAQDIRAMQIKLIKMGQAYLAKTMGMDDGAYRAMLAAQCDGKTSSTKLTGQEREKVLKHMYSLGFVVKSSKRASPHDQMAKLQAMWHALAEVGAVRRPGSNDERDQAIDAWAFRQMKGRLSSIRFADGRQMQRLVEAMKKWCDRVGAPDESDQARAERARLAGGASEA